MQHPRQRDFVRSRGQHVRERQPPQRKLIPMPPGQNRLNEGERGPQQSSNVVPPAAGYADAGATSFSRLARSRASAGIFSGALLTARTVVRIADAISCLLRSGRLLAYSVASRSARLGFEKRGASTRTRSSSHNRKKSESAGEPAAYGRSSSTFTESPLRNFSLSRALIPFSSSLNVFTKCLDDGRSLAGTRVKTSAAAVKCF